MDLRLILSKLPGKNVRFECGNCHKRFWMICKYIEHISTHKTQKEVKADDCNEAEGSRIDLNPLEQFEKQSHLTILPSNELSLKTKTVNKMCEIRNIDDEFSDSNSSFWEDYKPPKFVKTRSGRIVKAKKFFDPEPELKRLRKNSPMVLKKDSENTEMSPRHKALNKINFATKKTLTPADSCTLPKEVFNKELVVLVEKLPENVYKTYALSSNICALDSSNQKSVKGHIYSDSKIKLSNNGLKALKCFPVTTGSVLSKNLNHRNLKAATISSYPNSFMVTNDCEEVNCGTALESFVCETRTHKTKTNTSSKSDQTGNKVSNAEFNNSTDKMCEGTLSCDSKHSLLNTEKKLIERCKAKILEKERKKREKFELKKKLRYLEKIRTKNLQITKHESPEIQIIYEKAMPVFRETHNRSSFFESNIEDNKFPLELKEKSLSEIVLDLVNEDSPSGGSAKNLAFTPVSPQKYLSNFTELSRSS